MYIYTHICMYIYTHIYVYIYTQMGVHVSGVRVTLTLCGAAGRPGASNSRMKARVRHWVSVLHTEGGGDTVSQLHTPSTRQAHAKHTPSTRQAHGTRYRREGTDRKGQQRSLGPPQHCEPPGARGQGQECPPNSVLLLFWLYRSLCFMC